VKDNPVSHGVAAGVGPLRVKITPDGSPSMQEYRKKVLEELVTKKKAGGDLCSVMMLVVGMAPGRRCRHCAYIAAGHAICLHQQDGELDGYQLFEMIVAKWGVPYGVELRRLDFAGKKLLYVNVMWK
jgi:hypothetical protein